MDIGRTGLLGRGLAAGLLALGLGGCVYAPPYACDPTYPAYGYPAYGSPTYVGPPVTLDFGFSYIDRPRYRHDHGWSHHREYGGWPHHGGHRGWRGRH
ncbi:hypothetical protein DVK02_19140 [Halobellus sp. Atlit-31R]|nr:hypothetical protein DVK02_19140 [Halobellus sp. Atlit-31R]